MTNMVQFQDGVIVEIIHETEEMRAISGGAARKLSSAFSAAGEMITRAMKSIVASTADGLRDAGVSEAEIELGIGFSAEGQVYVAKAAGEGNIKITIKVAAKS